MLGEFNELAISLDDVREAVKEMKSGKAPGLDGFPVERLKKGGMAVLEWYGTGGMAVLEWYGTGGMAVLEWYGTGGMAVLEWYGTGGMAVLEWCGTGGMAVLEWVVRLNASFHMGGSTYGQCPCQRGRGTNMNVVTQEVLVLLSVVVKLLSRVQIKRGRD